MGARGRLLPHLTQGCLVGSTPTEELGGEAPEGPGCALPLTEAGASDPARLCALAVLEKADPGVDGAAEPAVPVLHAQAMWTDCLWKAGGPGPSPPCLSEKASALRGLAALRPLCSQETERRILCPPRGEEEAQQTPPPSLKDTWGQAQGQDWNSLNQSTKTSQSQLDQDAGAAALSGQAREHPSLAEPAPWEPGC